jgi:hypothetical protein
MTFLLSRLLLRSFAVGWTMLVQERVVREIPYLASTHPAVQGCIMDICAILWYGLTASSRRENQGDALRQAFYCERHLH